MGEWQAGETACPTNTSAFSREDSQQNMEIQLTSFTNDG
jgi:hypothetical protein